MTTKKLSDDFMQRIVEEEAWKELSGRLQWSEELLTKYQDKVDWHEVSRNTETLWTIPMIEKFKNRIDWKEFSGCAPESALTDGCIDTFMTKWDWSELTGNDNFILTEERLDKYAEKLDWERVINRGGWNCNLFEGKGIDFYERHKDHIPASELRNSGLWNEIVSQCRKQLEGEITK